MAKNWFTKLLFDWVFVLLCRLMQGLLKLVNFIESFFDIFAGTAKVMYKGSGDFLINIFFGHDAVTNAFWAMALIAIVMAFAFCIVGMARKAADVTDSVKQTTGQIFSSFIRCLVIILLINAISVAAVNISNVLLDRINFALENAAILDRDDQEKHFSDQEYAAMARVLATVANYSVNPSADSRYNINSCFNAVRNDLLALHVNGFFDYDYGMDANGHHTWQSALALLATSADLTADLKLDTYYSDVAYAVQTVSQEISTYSGFAPVETARVSTDGVISTDVLIFLIAGMEAAQNGMYNNGRYDDALRRGYVTGEKNYMNLNQVRRDFDIWEMDYLVAYIASIVFILIMAICIFTFIVRMFNLLLLYLVAPLFASSMPIDDGGKWQSWTQAFVIQLFSGFGSVIAMRLYLIIIPVALSSDLVYFPGEGVWFAILNRMAQLLMVLGGAWAVLQSSGVITGILAGNPGMAAIQQEGRIGGMVTQGAMSAVRGTKQIAGGILKSPAGIAKKAEDSRSKKLSRANEREQLATRKSQRAQVKADVARNRASALQAQASAPGASSRVRKQADHAQVQALKSQQRADRAKREGAAVYARQGGTQSGGSTSGVTGLGDTPAYKSRSGERAEVSALKDRQRADRAAGTEGAGSPPPPEAPSFSEIQVPRGRSAAPSDQSSAGGGEKAAGGPQTPYPGISEGRASGRSSASGAAPKGPPAQDGSGFSEIRVSGRSSASGAAPKGSPAQDGSGFSEIRVSSRSSASGGQSEAAAVGAASRITAPPSASGAAPKGPPAQDGSGFSEVRVSSRSSASSGQSEAAAVGAASRITAPPPASGAAPKEPPAQDGSGFSEIRVTRSRTTPAGQKGAPPSGGNSGNGAPPPRDKR